jgi:hypothetical protein
MPCILQELIIIPILWYKGTDTLTRAWRFSFRGTWRPSRLNLRPAFLLLDRGLESLCSNIPGAVFPALCSIQSRCRASASFTHIEFGVRYCSNDCEDPNYGGK